MSTANRKRKASMDNQNNDPPDKRRKFHLNKATANISIPQNVINDFQTQFAFDDLQSNIETAALLFAPKIPKNNVYTVSHVVIPKQSGDANSCVISNEEEINYSVDCNNMVCVGWVHTHPRQNNFLSSVDLHQTHFYGCTASTNIPFLAIVISPTDENMKYTGVYSLTNIGKSALAGCGRTGHHTHIANQVDMSLQFYETAPNCSLINSTKAIFCDLRSCSFTYLSFHLDNKTITKYVKAALKELKNDFDRDTLATAIYNLCKNGTLVRNGDTRRIKNAICNAINSDSK
eukprot:534170_1